MPISRQRSQPSTAGPSSSTMRWTSGSVQASSQRGGADPQRGERIVGAGGDRRLRRCAAVSSASTCSKTAANSSRLSANWW